MEQRFSEMSDYELRLEIEKLNDKAKKAEQMGMINELAVYERKIAMAQAYMMDPSQFKMGDVYEIKNDPGEPFEIAYINGTFAWGYRGKSEEQSAFPISLLGKKIEK